MFTRMGEVCIDNSGLSPYNRNLEVLTLVNLRHLYFIIPQAVASEAPAKTSRRSWRFSKKTKTVMAMALAAVILVSTIAVFLQGYQGPTVVDPTDNPTETPTATPQPTNSQNNPIDIGKIIGNIGQDISNFITPKQPGIIESSQTINSSTWKAIANYAWKYYQTGVGVDANTGLPWTGTGSPYITDWDVGVYIQAVINAKKLNLIDDDSTWGFNNRIDKVLTWLETRELNKASYPYWFYQANDGKVWQENANKVPEDYVDIVDTGRLLVALNNLKDYSQFANRIDTLVYNSNGNRSDYAKIVNGIKSESYSSTSIYGYYTTKGFESFWPSELSGVSNKIIDNMFAAGYTLTPENVSLPKAKISGDALLCSFFEAKNNDPRLTQLINLTYTAHEAYYNASGGKYRAFGEGPTFSTDWQWEWVVLPDGRTWTILNGDSQPTGQTPMIYTKIALSFLSMYNTNYTRSMAIYLEQNLSESTQGYFEGIDETGSPLNAAGSLTNGLILDAAVHYLKP